MQQIFEKNHRQQVIKPCLECKKSINTKLHNCRSFKGYLLHVRCADNLFSTLFLLSSLSDKKAFATLKRRSKEVVKIDKCLICGEHASGATGFKNRIVYEGSEVQLKIHRICLFNRFNTALDNVI